MVSPLQPSAHTFDSTTNLVGKHIEKNIARYAAWINVASTVKRVALAVITILAAGTCLLYVSPALPLIATIVLAAISIASITRSPSLSSDMYGLAFAISAAASLSTKLMTLVYTRQVINICLIFNGIFDLPLLCVAYIAHKVVEVLERKKLLLQQMATCVGILQVRGDYTPSLAMRQALSPLYNKIYLQEYNRGNIPFLPRTIEQQIARITSQKYIPLLPKER